MFASRRSFEQALQVAANQPVEANPVLLREAQHIIVLEPPSHLCDFRCGYAVVGRDQIPLLVEQSLHIAVDELTAALVEFFELGPKFLIQLSRAGAVAG